MSFAIIDQENWKRKSHFESISQKDPSIINMTVLIDITKLKQYLSLNRLRFYPFMVACISKIINQHNEFKMAYNLVRQLGIYDKIHPSYTIFHKDDCTYSCIYSELQENILSFYERIIQDMNAYANVKGFETRIAPENSFPISCIPWVTYAAYSIIEQKEKASFTPYVIIGRFFQKETMFMIPITMQISHSVADGYHVCLFFTELQNLLNSFI